MDNTVNTKKDNIWPQNKSIFRGEVLKHYYICKKCMTHVPKVTNKDHVDCIYSCGNKIEYNNIMAK